MSESQNKELLLLTDRECSVIKHALLLYRQGLLSMNAKNVFEKELIDTESDLAADVMVRLGGNDPRE